MFDVVALGELLIDFTENGLNEAGNPVLTANPGGAPCNVLAMLQKLGRKTAFIGKVGRDAFGDFLTATVEEQGICTKNLLKDEKVPTTLAFVHTAPDGDRSFSFYRNPGADMMLREKDIDYSVIDDSKLFHFGTLSMTDSEVEKATVAALDYAKKKGKLISFDPNLRPLLWDDMEHAKRMMIYGIEHCDILKIADDEICFLTGCDSVEAAVKAFTEKYSVKLACVTLGKNGSIALYAGRQVTAAPFIREDTIETTGAGDTFMACVINYCLENGLDNLTDEMLHEMLRFANAAAALITTRKGALKVMPERAEIEAL
ncbi:MAG: carbohydrate kinase [Lachnospiraceae bacterium]|nr:carbohydrate kinase [Lachnospiraceae bacterium]